MYSTNGLLLAFSLIYEAQARVNEPIYGCVGTITLLQDQVHRLELSDFLAMMAAARVAGSLSRASFVAGPNGYVTPRLPLCTTVSRAARDYEKSVASIRLIVHKKRLQMLRGTSGGHSRKVFPITVGPVPVNVIASHMAHEHAPDCSIEVPQILTLTWGHSWTTLRASEHCYWSQT
eukprot:SM000016S01899  [mRNA]  locus=s16:413428:414233:- [translate_table: standard]